MPKRNLQTFSIISIISILILLSPNSSALILPVDTFPSEGTYSEEGGTTILMEEYTATWCDICKLTDPKLEQISSANKNRIALVAVHPLDGVDTVSNMASAQRISRTMFSTSSMTPSFMFDAELEREGAVELIDIQSELLEAENNRKKYSKLDMNVSLKNMMKVTLVLNSDYNVNSTVLTILITENNVAGNTALSLEDVDEFDRVLQALFIANLTLLANSENSDEIILPEDYKTFGQYWGDGVNATMMLKKTGDDILLEVYFQAPSSWNLGNIGIIGAHELVNSSTERVISTLGAVQIIQLAISEKEDSSIWIIFMVTIFLTGFALAYIDKYINKNNTPKNTSPVINPIKSNHDLHH